jgi:hypothetical protein
MARESAPASVHTARESRANNSSDDPKTSQKHQARGAERRANGDRAVAAWLDLLAERGARRRTAPTDTERAATEERRDRRRRQRAPAETPGAWPADPAPVVELGAGLARHYADPNGAGTVCDPLRALEAAAAAGSKPEADPLRAARPHRRVGLLRARSLAAAAVGNEAAAAGLDAAAQEELRQLRGPEHDRAWREYQRAEWLERCEVATRGVRARRALHFRELGQARVRARAIAHGTDEAAADVLAAGHPGPDWHAARARGAAGRFGTVRECGQVAQIVQVCPACSTRQTIPLRCADRFFCSTCRAKAARDYRDQFRRSALGLARATESVGLTYRRDRNRRAKAEALGAELIGERLITLTAPHIDSDTTAERIDRLRDAWTIFQRRLAANMRARLGAGVPTVAKTPEGPRVVTPLGLVHWVAVYEWTPGSDGRGHPHLHVWHWGPYLSHDDLREWWADALRRASSAVERFAREREDASGEPWRPVVDVRAVRGGMLDATTKGGERIAIDAEIFKYLTKDWHESEHGARVQPEVYAEVYGAFLGRRLRQSSSGFGAFAVRLHRECSCCAFEGKWSRGIVSLPLRAGWDWRGDSWEPKTPRPPPSEADLRRMFADDDHNQSGGLRHERAWQERWRDRLDPWIGSQLDRLARDINPTRHELPPADQIEFWPF